MAKSSGKLYWYGGGGLDALLETDAAGNTPTEYVFFSGKRAARRDPSGSVFYYFANHLGSANVVTNSAGTIVEDSDYYPFGGERAVVNADPNPYKFTGKERDAESNLDFFIARYYSSAQGRFLTPDEFTGGPVDAFSSNDPLPPGPLPYADITNPQSLNKYTYVWNNPLEYVDPDGHQNGVAAPPAPPPTPTAPPSVPVSTTVRVIMLSEGAEAAPAAAAGGGAVAAGLAFGLVGAAGLAAYSAFDLTRAEVAQEALFAEVGEQNRQKLAQQQQQQEQASPQPQTGNNPQTTERSEEHKKGARPSTEEKHEEGQARKRKDKGGEKADEKRRQHGMGWGKRPKNWKGKWPPEQKKDEKEL